LEFLEVGAETNWWYVWPLSVLAAEEISEFIVGAFFLAGAYLSIWKLI